MTKSMSMIDDKCIISTVEQYEVIPISDREWEFLGRNNVQGLCRQCGRQIMARLKYQNSTQCHGRCPHCGTYQLYVKCAGVFTDDIGAMNLEDALLYATTCESQPELELLFRLEILGADRREIVDALRLRYLELDEWYGEFGKPRNTTDEIRVIVKKDFESGEAYKARFKGRIRDPHNYKEVAR